MRIGRSLWFFLTLALLGAVAVTVPILYNLGLQLKPEQLMEARERWRAKGPRDYVLTFGRKVDQDPQVDEYRVEVRGGKVLCVVENGALTLAENVQPVLGAGAGLSLAALNGQTETDEALRGRSVDGLFDLIEDGLKQDESPNGRNFATASFDPADGHPTHYVHRVKGTGERLELIVRLVRVDEGRR
jgi:hypothetical protein